MKTLKILHFVTTILIIVPLMGVTQVKEDFSDSRFEMDETGFHDKMKVDTTFFTDGKIAVIGHYAIDKSGRMSGKKVGL